MKFRALTLSLVVATTAGLYTGLSAADTITLAQLRRESGVFDGNINDVLFNPTKPMERSIGDQYGSASTLGVADYGVLKANATVTTTGGEYSAYYARSAASFSDSLVFSSTTHNGQSGFAVVSLLFDRSFNFTGKPTDSYANGALTFTTQFDSFFYSEILACPIQTVGCGPQLSSFQQNGVTMNGIVQSQNVLINVPIIFGESTNISLTVDFGAYANPGPSTWEADASHSLYWDGVQTVLDSNGQPLNFNLTSASGTNYLQSFAPAPVAVPAPSTLALMLLGLLGILTKLHIDRRTI